MLSDLNCKAILRTMLICIVLASVGVFSVGAKNIQVCPFDCQYSTVQQAIDNASSGDSITLEPAIYVENITINKDLTVQAPPQGKATIKGYKGGNTAIEIGPANIQVQLSNLVVSKAKNGIVVKGSSHLTISGSKISRNETGLIANDDGEVVVENSIFSDNEQNKVLGKGILLKDQSKATLNKVSVIGNPDGIVVQDEASLSVYDSIISRNTGTGIILQDSARATLEGNTLVGSYLYGIALHTAECNFRGERVGFGGNIQGKLNQFKENGVLGFCPENLSFLTAPEGGEFDQEVK